MGVGVSTSAKKTNSTLGLGFTRFLGLSMIRTPVLLSRKRKGVPRPHPRGDKTPKYTAEQVVIAVYKGYGLVSRVARILEVTERTVRNYKKRWVSVDAAFRECRRELTDRAEFKLRDAIDAGDTRSIHWTLARLGADRGYVQPSEKLDLTVGVGKTVEAKLASALRKAYSDDEDEE